MNNKYLLLIIITILSSFKLTASAQKIGITRVYFPYKKIETNFYLNLENQLMNAISDMPSKEFYALNIDNKLNDLKKGLDLWRDTTDDLSLAKIDKKFLNIINELKEVDYCIAFETIYFQINKEQDFYDIDKYGFLFNISLGILVIDCKNKTFIEEERIEINFKSNKEKEIVLNKGISIILKKFSSYLEYQSIFKPKIRCTKIKPILVWLDAGKNDGIKSQNILVSYEKDEYNVKEHTVLRIIKADSDTSLAMILYTKGNINEEYFFTKRPKINLEIQCGGGFSISDKDNRVLSKTSTNSFLSFGFIRALIPVGIAFFRPVFQAEFNFFYLDNKILMPFTFEVGCQGELYIHRFEADLGLMIGALFSPDLNRNYQLDSIVVRPYLHLSALLITSVKLFSEFGYRFVMEGNFYKEWEIDLKGIYFAFGIGVNL